jgi:hypothetical protein
MRILPLWVVWSALGLVGGLVFLAGPGHAPVPAPRFGPPPPGPLAAGPAAYRPELRRYPYLTDVVGSSATVNWATDQSGTTGSVAWGRVGVESCTAHTTPAIRATVIISTVTAYQWSAPLALTAGTEYCYRVYQDALDLLGSDPSPHFWTQVPATSSAPFSFAVFGDWGWVDSSGQNTHQANLLARVAASGARFAVTTGDNGYPAGSQANYGDLYQVGPNLSAIFGPDFWTVAGASIPIFPTMGNHGFDRADAVHPHLLNWPQAQAVATSGGRYLSETYCCVNGTNPGDYPSTWYAFDAGGARFYVLETAWDDANLGSGSSYANDYAAHWTPGSAEYQWLEHDLLTHPSPLKFAFFHYPLYSDQSVDHSDPFLQGPGSLEGLLSRNGVNIAFTGHAHVYQRNLKLAPHSLVSYVTGGGGGDLEPMGALGCSPENAYGIGWSDSAAQGSACGSAPVPASITQVYHFLLVRISDLRVTVTPTDELGRTFDVRSYNFDPPPTATPCPIQFTDVPPANPFYSYVRCLACRGIVSGYPCGGPGEPCPGTYYRPNNNVTRGQTAKIVAEAAGFADPVPATRQTFEDIGPGSTFHAYIERLSTRGIIGGYPCGGPNEPCVPPANRPYFRPNNNVTRGQLAKIVSLAAGWTEPPAGQTFQDAPPGSTFYPYIEWVASRGIVGGYPCGGLNEPCVAPGNRPYFRPNSNATRGQMSKIAAAAFYPNCQTPAVGGR